MEKIRCIYAVLANKIIRCIFLCSYHCLYKSFWKGFESDQRRLLNNIAGHQITGSPSSKYEHRRASALLRNIQNTRRCGSVYLGVVVLRIRYFEHALLQLNSCHHILPEKINHLLYLFAEPQLIQYVPIHNNNPVTSWQCLEICTSSMPTCLEPNCNIGHEWLQPGE